MATTRWTRAETLAALNMSTSNSRLGSFTSDTQLFANWQSGWVARPALWR
jgi:hypothetical protein